VATQLAGEAPRGGVRDERARLRPVERFVGEQPDPRHRAARIRIDHAHRLVDDQVVLAPLRACLLDEGVALGDLGPALGDPRLVALLDDAEEGEHADDREDGDGEGGDADGDRVPSDQRLIRRQIEYVCDATSLPAANSRSSSARSFAFA